MARPRTQESKPTRTDSEQRSAGETPKQGETYRCGGCGMELEVTVDCNCEDPKHVRLECCGQELTRVY